MDIEYFKSLDMWWGTLGTVRPFSNFNPDKDAMELQAALEKKDVNTVVRILSNRNNAQRQVISQTFEELIHKDLQTALKKVLSGDLETFMLQLMMYPLHFEAFRLQQAMAGLGTDEETLMEILCTKSAKQLQDVSVAYNQFYKKDLEKELKAETSGDFAKLVVALLNKQSVSGVVQRDIEVLSASLKGKKAEASPWIDILTSRDVEYLNKVFMGLEMETGQTLDQIVEKRFSGDFRMGLNILVQCIENPFIYLAKRLHTMKTPVVHGIMVSHSEEDLLCIRAAFIKITDTSLYTALQKNFKGDHLQALLAICRSED
ncbi:annexin A2 [Gouania willdenowi]|uniref:Annexin A2-like n=1 Tax=Gouania willdenowi TaxID=441366 RepID=A0A8C5EZI2_GOUWI|nr:annexin A2-like [Gouania willdenowi]